MTARTLTSLDWGTGGDWMVKVGAVVHVAHTWTVVRHDGPYRLGLRWSQVEVVPVSELEHPRNGPGTEDDTGVTPTIALCQDQSPSFWVWPTSESGDNFFVPPDLMITDNMDGTMTVKWTSTAVSDTAVHAANMNC